MTVKMAPLARLAPGYDSCSSLGGGWCGEGFFMWLVGAYRLLDNLFMDSLLHGVRGLPPE